MMNSLKCRCTPRVLALAVALLFPVVSAHAVELVINGDFEQNTGAGTQSFGSWTAASQPGSQGGFFAQQGAKGPVTPVAVPTAPQGSFAAMSDQPAPGSHALYQDISIPAGATAMLTARVFVQNAAKIAASPASLNYASGAPNQQARIDVMNPTASWDDVGSGVLANVFQWPPSSATPVNTVNSGAYQAVQLDLSAYAGQTVRLRIAEVDNRQSLFFGVDSVSVMTNGVPSGLAAPSNVAYFLQGTNVVISFAPVASTSTEVVTGYLAQCAAQNPVGPTLSGSASASPVTVTALVPGAQYSCQVAAQKADLSTGPLSAAVSFTAPAIPAGPGSNVPLPQGGTASVQVSGPGGIPTTGVLSSVSFSAVQSAPVLPPQGAAAFPFGLMSLRITGLTPGDATQTLVTLPKAIPAGAQYWKYGPTADNATPHWYDFSSSVTFVGNTVALNITDGGIGDDDLAKNGQITDPGGVMVPVDAVINTATPVPVWSVWGWLLASLALFGAFAGVRSRRD